MSAQAPYLLPEVLLYDQHMMNVLLEVLIFFLTLSFLKLNMCCIYLLSVSSQTLHGLNLKETVHYVCVILKLYSMTKL